MCARNAAHEDADVEVGVAGVARVDGELRGQRGEHSARDALAAHAHSRRVEREPHRHHERAARHRRARVPHVHRVRPYEYTCTE